MRHLNSFLFLSLYKLEFEKMNISSRVFLHERDKIKIIIIISREIKFVQYHVYWF